MTLLRAHPELAARDVAALREYAKLHVKGNPAVFQGPRPVKIPRRQARAIVVRSLSLGSCNNYLQSWYRRWQRGMVDRPSPFHAVASLLP